MSRRKKEEEKEDGRSRVGGGEGRRWMRRMISNLFSTIILKLTIICGEKKAEGRCR